MKIEVTQFEDLITSAVQALADTLHSSVAHKVELTSSSPGKRVFTVSWDPSLEEGAECIGEGKNLAQYLTQSPLQFGYDTVLGYLAKKHWDDLDEMLDCVRDVVCIHRRCEYVCKDRHITTFPVVAPNVMLRAGIETISSYPAHIIREAVNSYLNGTL